MSCKFDFIRFSAERWESEMMVQIGNITKKKDGGTKNHKKHHLVFWDFLRIPPWWIFLTSSPPKKPQLSRTPCELGYWNHRPLKNAPRAKTPAVLLFLPTFSSQCWIFVCGSQTRTRKGRCWGLKSIYFLTGNRRKNTPQLLNSLVSCGCFCFKSSRFFSTIFWTPKKGLAFFSRGKSKQLADVRSPGVATMKPSEFHSRSGWQNFKRISTKFSRNSWVSVKKLLG